MLTAEQYARVQIQMCMAYVSSCKNCPFQNHTDETGKKIDCVDFTLYSPAEAVKLVELWWEENRHRYDYLNKGRKPNENVNQ